MFMCAETDEAAREKADGATFFQFCLRFYNTADRKRPAPGEVEEIVGNAITSDMFTKDYADVFAGDEEFSR